ncbi:MAG: AMP-binding protein [Opitutaceae bacterium]|nr:AMP-binding protein [Cytophagales bacterium]
MFSQGKTFKSNLEIKQFQEEQLRIQLQYLNTHSSYYKNQFKSKGINPENIQSIEDLDLLPVTNKEDLQNPDNDILCIPKEDIAEYFTTSGTLGDPVVFPLSENDLQRLAYNEFLSFKRIGAKKGDVALLTVTSDKCFMAGNAYSLGARKAGITIIKTGPGLPEFQWSTILKLKPTIIIAVPSFILKLIEFAQSHNIDFKKSSIKKALCVGESLRTRTLEENALAKSITDQWPIKLYSTYASTEMNTAFTECEFGKGGHLNPELIIVECLDENNKPAKPGIPGDITITNLGLETTPLLRFKTGDMAIIHTEKCECGEISLRIGPIIGRNKQMIKYKGTTLYPDAIRQTLQGLSYIDDYYIEVTTDNFGMDDLIVHMAIKSMSIEVEKIIADSFRSHLRIVPKLTFNTKSEIQAVKNNPKLRKPIDFVDNRITI